MDKSKKNVLEEISPDLLKEYHIDPLKERVDSLEKRLSVEALTAFNEKFINEWVKKDGFRSKVKALFNENLKIDDFINKVESIATKTVKGHIDKTRVKTIFWVLGLAVAGIIGVVIQKVFKVF